MTCALRFLPAVEEDIRMGQAWYEEKSPGQGEAFVRAFYDCARELTHHRRRWQKVHRDFRRCLLHRFPYALYYRVMDDGVIVVGVFHCARDPHRLHRALGDRTPQS